MERRILRTCLVLALGIATGMIGNRLLFAAREPVVTTVLFRTDLAGVEGKEARVDTVEMAPRESAERHYQPGNEIVYVLEGRGIWEAEGRPLVEVKEGDVFYNGPGLVYDFKNTSTIDRVRLLVFRIAEKGAPFRVPLK